MKDLYVQKQVIVGTRITNGLFACYDSITNELVIATRKTLHIYNCAVKKVAKEICVIKDSEDDSIASLENLVDDMQLCVITMSGKIILVDPNTDYLDDVGTMSQGVQKAEWSPDMELFVLITGQDTFMVMSRYFDDICEFPLHSTNRGEAEQVNVGWGKKETQFHGSEGKEAAKVVKPTNASEKHTFDSGDVHISWRGDGQYFAISSVNKVDNCRYIRIYNRDGILQNTNEIINGLEETLSWRPSGNLIVSSQRKPNKHDIIFFEKNGLQHGEFTLPFTKDEKIVVHSTWNANSDILLLLIKDIKTPNDYTLLLWTSSNYHWYLKKVIQMQAQENAPLLLWDNEQSYTLHVIKHDGEYMQYFFQYTINQSYYGNSMAMVAVTDGKRLLATPFKNMVIPPPMSAYQVCLPMYISCIAFGVEDNQHNILLQLFDCSFALLVYKDDQYDTQLISYKRTKAFSHLKWYHHENVVAVHTNADGNFINFLQLDRNKNAIFEKCILKVTESIFSIGCVQSSSRIYFQDDKGIIFHVANDLNSYEQTDVALPLPCSTIQCFLQANKLIVFGLTLHFRLYMNSKELATDCTSFFIHDEFLLLTTHSHTLRSIYLSSLFKSLTDGEHSTNNKIFDEASRRVERGSRIVTAVKGGTAVILQMPRGNLECIHPRALVITHLQKLLDKLLYQEAMEVMRKNRINLNLFFDHNPKLLLENLQKFLVDVEAIDRINQFLADLIAEDVCTSLYYPFYHHGVDKLTNSQVTFVDKVDEICDKLRKVIEEVSVSKYFLCLLTTYAKQTHADLESVLLKIKQLKAEPSLCENLNYDGALKYILYLVDVNVLFDVALGLYDFDIVLMVAQKSQKDPKEYLPFLNNFKNMETNYRMYSIDKYLKRYKKALQHLSLCEDRFNELIEFVREHRLHREALKMYKPSTNQHKQLSLQYGEYLVSQKLYEDAGVVFARNDFHKEALEAFLKTTNWNAVLLQAHALKYTNIQMNQLCKDLVAILKNHRMYDHAATIYETHLKNEEECVVCLLEGRLWFRALHVIESYERKDLIETNFKPAIIEQSEQTLDQIRETSMKFTKYKDRLQTVLTNREKAEIEYAQGLRDDPDNDLISEVTSIAGESVTSLGSRGTRSTGRTNKSRSKAGRKKFSLREGSKHEDFALREELAQLTISVDAMKDDVSKLLKVLVMFFYDEKALNIQSEFSGLVSLIEENYNHIWNCKSQSNIESSEFGPEYTVQSIIEKKQQNNNQTIQNELPNPTVPVMRKDIHWKVHLLRS